MYKKLCALLITALIVLAASGLTHALPVYHGTQVAALSVSTDSLMSYHKV